MKHAILTFSILFLLFSSKSNSQITTYGNEWIEYGQPYLKMVVDSKGIYRITKADLDTYGFVTTSKNPKNFQVWFRGKQMAINIIGEADETWDEGDYIEFYAINNDGKQDIELYDLPASKPAMFSSLYSDETAYFLTVSVTLGKRMAQEPAATNATDDIDDYFFYTQIKNFNNRWNYDNGLPTILLDSRYEKNEGLTGNDIANFYSENVILNNLATISGVVPKFETSVFFRGTSPRAITINLGNGISSQENMVSKDNKVFSQDITTITGNSIPFNISKNITDTQNPFSLFYYKVKYPRLPVFLDANEIELKLNTKGFPLDISHLQFSSVPGTVAGYEISDIENQSKINISINSGVMDIYVANASTTKKIWLNSVTKKPKTTQIINFSIIDQSISNYLIITDSRLRSGADEYKAYRESTPGGSFEVLVTETKAIYDQFCYGERNPIAIRRFVDYMTSTPKAIKYLFLIGKSISKPNQLKSQEANDFVPTFGYPGSDILFSSGLLGNPSYIPSIPTGRLVVTSNQEVTNYLSKVTSYEAMDPVLNNWQKNMLCLAGPTFQQETSLATTLESLRTIAINGSYAMNPLNYATITKPLSSIDPMTGQYPTFTVNADFYDKINQGVGIFAYYGHGFTDGSVYNFGYASVASSAPPFYGGPINYVNNGKYPLMLAYGCNLANSFTTINDITSDWVKTPNRGAINAIAQSWFSYEYIDTKNLNSLFNTWFGSIPNAKITVGAKQKSTNAMTNNTIGDILKQSQINNAATNGDPTNDLYALANYQQTMLIGDPAVVIFKANSQPLPLTLLNFTAKNNENNINLNWQTENEKNFEKFEVEKSLNGKSFENIGSVNANQSGDILKEYSFDDFTPQNGLNYYRLKMIDFGGKYSYSPIISVKSEVDQNLKIFSNPLVSNKFDFELFDYQPNSEQFIDLNGKIYTTRTINNGIAKYNLSINENLVKGIYIFKVADKKGKFYSKKLLVE